MVRVVGVASGVWRAHVGLTACLHREGMNDLRSQEQLEFDDAVGAPVGLPLPKAFESQEAYERAYHAFRSAEAQAWERRMETAEYVEDAEDDELTPEEREDAEADAILLKSCAEEMVKSGQARDLGAAYQLMENDRTRMQLGEDTPIYMHRYGVTI
ncbi:hypothetical protein ASF71_20510 [Deinococcus sp. Leaf326]|nr:hypothetical protein ASF71_20510 [Deinococcus sp. Leaf326]